MSRLQHINRGVQYKQSPEDVHLQGVGSFLTPATRLLFEMINVEVTFAEKEESNGGSAVSWSGAPRGQQRHGDTATRELLPTQDGQRSSRGCSVLSRTDNDDHHHPSADPWAITQEMKDAVALGHLWLAPLPVPRQKGFSFPLCFRKIRGIAAKEKQYIKNIG